MRLWAKKYDEDWPKWKCACSLKPDERDGEILNTIVFLPSNRINVHKNSVLLNELKNAGFRVLVLCIDELVADAVTARQSIVESGFEYLSISGGSFRRNSHWVIQSFQKSLVVDPLKVLFDNEAPVLLLTAYDGDVVPFWICKEFQKRRLPVVLVPDGMVLEESPSYSVTSYYSIKRFVGKTIKKICGVGDLRGSSKPDYVMLLNASGRGAFAEFGITPDRVYTVGTPEYENLANNSLDLVSTEDSKKNIYSKLAISLDRPFIFFAHQSNFGLSNLEMFEFVFTMASAAKHSGATLVVKFHHRSDNKIIEWEEWRESVNLSDQDVMFTNHHLYSIDILTEATLCITAFSTVGLEAIFCKTPLIVIKFLNTQYELQFAEDYDCAWNVHSLSQLDEAIKVLLSDENKRNYYIESGLTALKTEVALGGKSSIEKSVALIQRIVSG